ncbi:hypothetical protein EPA93_05260 [Ktedonosporobacter rubrisoli]|uniref:Uncharacterized protein n=1 Tax=Ktedonosporobacter rubrisoli TaxID=2509675 RepID=A0A4P6JKE6_KTERU|nr:hypothetical protein [Ktedonosporobacter rubrisoli]QBD75442.1 hypothetical protein EPA93_05260 [Ktedonosporobacter rubrisoli]
MHNSNQGSGSRLLGCLFVLAMLVLAAGFFCLKPDNSGARKDLLYYGTITKITCGGLEMRPQDLCDNRTYDEQVAYLNKRQNDLNNQHTTGGLLILAGGILWLISRKRE